MNVEIKKGADLNFDPNDQDFTNFKLTFHRRIMIYLMNTSIGACCLDLCSMRSKNLKLINTKYNIGKTRILHDFDLKELVKDIKLLKQKQREHYESPFKGSHEDIKNMSQEEFSQYKLRGSIDEGSIYNQQY